MKARAMTVAAACAVGLVLITLPAEGAAKFGVTAKVTTSAPMPGASVTFTGGVRPKVRKKLVKLQRQVDGRWRTVATTRTSSTGRYKIKVVPPTGGSHYRVCKARTAATRAGCSKTLKVRPRTYRWMSFRQNPYVDAYKFRHTDPTVIAGKTYGNSYETKVDQELWQYPSLSIPLGGLCDKFRFGLGYVRDGELAGGRGTIEVRVNGPHGRTVAVLGSETGPRVVGFSDVDVRKANSIAVHASLGPNDDHDGRDWPTLAILSPQVRCVGLPEDD